MTNSNGHFAWCEVDLSLLLTMNWPTWTYLGSNWAHLTIQVRVPLDGTIRLSEDESSYMLDDSVQRSSEKALCARILIWSITVWKIAMQNIITQWILEWQWEQPVIFLPEIKFLFHILIDLMMISLWAMVFVNLLGRISTQAEDSNWWISKRPGTLDGQMAVVPDLIRFWILD